MARRKAAELDGREVRVLGTSERHMFWFGWASMRTRSEGTKRRRYAQAGPNVRAGGSESTTGREESTDASAARKSTTGARRATQGARFGKPAGVTRRSQKARTLVLRCRTECVRFETESSVFRRVELVPRLCAQ